ncbi:glutamyl-tRNA amidotransferase [Parathielavia hyrcaniae]|uniref:Glutamyl-tRNA amidotransferase n=1 Tax=Parathielavia hyrcaniae TaxID=113614 RepID=A0AAN6PWT1_9PEZI|nr:glutamyl-tRNA amidotransferase [Parathielavia hyrcaniae]
MASFDQRASARFLHLSVASLLARLASASAVLTSTGLSVKLNDVNYYVSPFSSGKVVVPRCSLGKVPDVVGFKPVTVVQGAFAQSDLPQLFANWTAIDDVWQPAFSEAIFMAESHNHYGQTNSTVVISLKNSTAPSGPYFLQVATGSLYPVYRLYEDFAGAFTEPLIPTPEGKFQAMSAKIPGAASLTIGVPSRLYFTKTAEKPLAGVRLGVKDIYRLAGVKGTNGNRAWYNLYPASEVTGTAVQRLIDAGAQVVGIQKTSQFANGESATADWVDYHAPFNPRGDGYNDPSSSSSGAGASIASYEWLDIAIGSDTGGSIRGPAGVQGLFGNRPSQDLVSLDAVMPLAPTLDTPGFLVRDPYIWNDANAAMYGQNYTSLAGKKPKYPKQIYVMNFPSSPSNAANTLLLDFASALASFIGGTTTALNLEAQWAASKPAAAGNATLSTLLSATYATIISKEQTPLIRDPFYRDYAAAHNGRLPFINPVPLRRWAYGDSLPASALDEAYAAKSLFQSWFNTEILPPASSSSPDEAECSSSLIVYVGSTGNPNPRNTYRGAPGIPLGFGTSRISVFSGVPDSVFPIGEVARLSSITGVEEMLPVAVNVLAAAGCDGLVVRLAQELVEAGLLKVPKAGGTMEGGEVLMRRGLVGDDVWQ